MHENRYRLAENPRKVFANRKAASRQFSFRSKRKFENSVTQSKTKGERISFTFIPNVVAYPNDVKFSRNEPIARIHICVPCGW